MAINKNLRMNEVEQTDNSLKLSKYIIRFGVLYFILTIFIAVALSIAKLNGSGADMLSTLFAAILTASRFVKDNNRLPSSLEKKRLIWYSFITNWVISIVFILVVFGVAGGGYYIDKLESADVYLYSQLALAVMFISAISLGLLYMGYGSFAKREYEKLVKNGKL